MDTILQDVRYAVRALLRQPAVTVAVALTLAIGVGLNGAVFSVVSANLFKPLPVRNPGEIVLLGMTTPELDKPHEMSWPDILDLKQLPVYADVGAWTNTIANLGSSAGGHPERVFVDETSANYFALLGVDAVIGRTFAAGEDTGPGAHRVLVLDHGFWQRHFQGDSAVVGRTVAINGQQATIIGVLPASFHGVQAILDPQGYMPLNQTGTDWTGQMQERDGGFLNVVARLAPGVSLAQARAASVALGERLAKEYPATNEGTAIVAVAEQRARPHLFLSAYTLPASMVFMTLAGLVLLVACANVAGLLLSRTASRERELAVRAALGAGRGRIARLLLIESLLLGAVGGGAAVLVASWCAGALSRLHFAVDVPIRFEVQADARVFGFTLALALLAGVVAGLAPALRGAAANLGGALRAGARAGGPVRQRLRSGLVVAQVAVAIVVLGSAGLFVRSLQRAGEVNLGFHADHLLLASVSPVDQGYDNARSHDFADRLVARIATLPGVRSVALARLTPMGYNNSSDRILPEGGLPDGSESAVVFHNVVTPGYFATMGITLLEGRDFAATDSAGAPRSAVVSRAMAKLIWPNGSAVGRRFRISGDSVPRVVVGVVENTVWMSPSEEPRPFLYYAASQGRFGAFTLNIRTSGDPVAMAPAVRAAVGELDADLPLYDVRSLRQHLDGGLAFFSLRFGAVFSAVFGVLAMLLGAVGLFGLIAFSVAQRTREIGIRLALGADASGVQALILRRALRLVGAGLLIGLPFALLVGRAMNGLLVQTRTGDPLALGGGAALLVLVAAVAAWLPSRRAARVDPMEALRSE